MNLTMNDAFQRLRGLLEGGLQTSRRPPRFPSIAVEVAQRHVIAVRVVRDRKTGKDVLMNVQRREIPEGAIEPSLSRLNIRQIEPVQEAVRDVLKNVDGSDHRVSILIPDHVARVTILSFATLPKLRREVIDLVRFRMAKSLPFKADEAAMDLQILSGHEGSPGAPGAASILSIFVKRAIVEQYEALFSGAGYWPGLVGLSTFELFNLFRAEIEADPRRDRDVVLLNVTANYLSIGIFNDGRLIFYRCRPHQSTGSDEERVTALHRELYTSLAYYQEKLLGRGIGRAFLRVVGLPAEAVQTAVAAEAVCEVTRLDLMNRIGLNNGVELDPEAAMWAAPAAGAAAGRRT